MRGVNLSNLTDLLWSLLKVISNSITLTSVHCVLHLELVFLVIL